MNSELPSTIDDSFRQSSNRVQEESDRRHDLMANAQARPESLNDFLLHQLAELDIDDRVEKLAERIISTLDARDGGYLKVPLPICSPPGTPTKTSNSPNKRSCSSSRSSRSGSPPATSASVCFARSAPLSRTRRKCGR